MAGPTWLPRNPDCPAAGPPAVYRVDLTGPHGRCRGSRQHRPRDALVLRRHARGDRRARLAERRAGGAVVLLDVAVSSSTPATCGTRRPPRSGSPSRGRRLGPRRPSVAARSRARRRPRPRPARARRWRLVALAAVAITGTVGAVVASCAGGSDGGAASTPARSLVTLTGVDAAMMDSLGLVSTSRPRPTGLCPLATAEDDMRTAIGGQLAVTDAQLVDLARPDAPADDPGRLCWPSSCAVPASTRGRTPPEVSPQRRSWSSMRVAAQWCFRGQ